MSIGIPRSEVWTIHATIPPNQTPGTRIQADITITIAKTPKTEDVIQLSEVFSILDLRFAPLPNGVQDAVAEVDINEGALTEQSLPASQLNVSSPQRIYAFPRVIRVLPGRRLRIYILLPFGSTNASNVDVIAYLNVIRGQ